MQYILAITLNFMAMSFKKYKEVYFVLLFFLWFLAAFNYDNADKVNYYSNYIEAGYNQGFTDAEFVYQLTNKIANYLGLDFSVFLGVYFLVGLLLLSRIILKFTNNPGYVLALYFIYPFIIDVTQIRNFMAMAIMLNAIPYLASTRKIDLFKYLALLLLAILFHYSAIFYLLFMLVRFLKIKKLIKVVTILTFVASLLYYSLSKLIVELFPFLDTQMHRYTQSSVSIYTAIGMFLYLTVGLILVYISYRNIKENQGFDIKINPRFAEMVLKINIIMFMLFPFLLFAFEFIRLYRNILPLNYILFASVITYKRGKLLQVYLYRMAIIIFVVLSSWYFIYYQFSDTVFFPLFEKNYFFD